MAAGGVSEGNQRLAVLWDEFRKETEHLYQEGNKKGNIYVIKIHKKNFQQHLYYLKLNQGKSVISPTVNPYKYCKAIHSNFQEGVVEEVTDKYGQLRQQYFVIGHFNQNIGWRDFDKNTHTANQNENSSYGMVLYEKAHFSANWEIISLQVKNTPFKRRARNTSNTFVIDNHSALIIDYNSITNS